MKLNRSTKVAVALSLAALLPLTACAKTPESSASEKPTVELPEMEDPAKPSNDGRPSTSGDYTQEAEEARARELYQRWIDGYNRGEHNGFNDPAMNDEIGLVLGTPARETFYGVIVPGMQGKGIITQGDRTVKYLNFTEFIPGDPTTGEGVTLYAQACIDASQVEYIMQDGSPVEIAGNGTDTYLAEVIFGRPERDLLILQEDGGDSSC